MPSEPLHRLVKLAMSSLKRLLRSLHRLRAPRFSLEVRAFRSSAIPGRVSPKNPPRALRSMRLMNRSKSPCSGSGCQLGRAGPNIPDDASAGLILSASVALALALSFVLLLVLLLKASGHPFDSPPPPRDPEAERSREKSLPLRVCRKQPAGAPHGPRRRGGPWQQKKALSVEQRFYCGLSSNLLASSPSHGTSLHATAETHERWRNSRTRSLEEPRVRSCAELSVFSSVSRSWHPANASSLLLQLYSC